MYVYIYTLNSSNNNYHSETSPLLIKKNPHQNYLNDNINQKQPHYQSTTSTTTPTTTTVTTADESTDDDESDSDTTSDDSDSDDPFFPPSSNQKISTLSSTAATAGSRSGTNNSSSTVAAAITTTAKYQIIDDDQGLYNKKNYSWYHYPQSFFQQIMKFISLTPQKQLVLKCSFAYLIGCLFTFVPVFNSFIGNNRTSSHLVATATVFFNPAKTLGGMLEASLYGWAFVLFANVICFGSMFTTDYFVDKNQFAIAHAISLMFWLAGSTFIVAYLKAHWNKPPVATGKIYYEKKKWKLIFH